MDIREIYMGCRSFRQFEQEPVSDEVMNAVLENMRIAPSGCNFQQLRYIIVRNKDVCKEIFPYTRWATAAPKEVAWPREGEEPPTYIFILKPVAPKALIDVDMGIVASMAVTTAWTYGIGSCMLGSVNIAKVSPIIGVNTDEYKIGLVIAMGKPKHKSTLVDVPENGCIDYYLDEDRNFYVPKRSMDELVVDWID